MCKSRLHYNYYVNVYSMSNYMPLFLLQNTWRRLSIDECSIDAELDEHNSTCSSIMTNSTNSSRSRSSISSSTASVLSLASLSSNNSSRCSFSSGSSSGVSSGSSSSCSNSDTPDKDRKLSATRQLTSVPRSATPISKMYPISVEENIQSYFAMPSDDELENEKIDSNESPRKVISNRPPQPLPRRILSFPAVPLYVNSVDIKFINDSEGHSSLRKSFSTSACSPKSLARGPTAQIWQNRSRSARIRSATISSPLEHSSTSSLFSRSKSSEPNRHSTSTLTSQPSTPTTPNSSSQVFTFRTSLLNKSQSTSSIHTPGTSSKSSVDQPLIFPSSTKLRPLSLAPNSCVAFPSRPSSLLSTQSQSTCTLRASSSSVCLIASSPETCKNSAIVPDKQTPVKCSSLKFESETQLPKSNKDESSTLHKEVTSETHRDSKNVIPTNFDKENSEESKSKTESEVKPCVSGNCSKSERNCSSVSIKPVCDGSSAPPEQSSTQHCQSCCRYDNCFYIWAVGSVFMKSNKPKKRVSNINKSYKMFKYIITISFEHKLSSIWFILL